MVKRAVSVRFCSSRSLLARKVVRQLLATQTGEPPREAEILTRPEAAAMLRISTRTLDVWCKCGLMPHVRIGRSVRFTRTAILNHLGGSR